MGLIPSRKQRERMYKDTEEYAELQSLHAADKSRHSDVITLVSWCRVDETWSRKSRSLCRLYGQL